MPSFVVDVQVLMIGSGLSAPADDGACRSLMAHIKERDDLRLTLDSESLIKTQYEAKLRPQTFGRDWLQEMLSRGRVSFVARAKLSKGVSQAIRATGLVGEDLNYYVRTAAASSDRLLVSEDSDYDESTCKVLKKTLDVVVLGAKRGVDMCQQTVQVSS
jgi:hypothetical protein